MANGLLAEYVRAAGGVRALARRWPVSAGLVCWWVRCGVPERRLLEVAAWMEVDWHVLARAQPERRRRAKPVKPLHWRV